MPLAVAALAGLPPQDTARAAVLHVSVISSAVRLDGRPDEPFWAAADSIDDFRQREPLEGAPASERTVVRAVRDADALYVGGRLYDSDMSALRATQLRRDGDLFDNDDEITVLIDGLRDRRSGFLFGTNPNGAMWDAEITLQDEVNDNWNGIWAVAVSRDLVAWTVEFRIPFRTLRFQAESAATFGFNVQRSQRRKNEEDLWQGWRRTQGFFRQQYEGELAGLGRLGRARDVDLRPYALGRAIENDHDLAGAVAGNGGVDGKVGLDTKVALTPTP